MWRRYRGIGFLLVLSSILFGCGTAAVQTGDHPEQSEPIHSQSQTPPSLELKIGDDTTIRTFRGRYSWSYYDAEEKMMAGIEAESIPLHDIIDMDGARKVDRNEAVTLEFGEPPLSYYVYAWNEAGNRSKYQAGFDLTKYEGKNLFEINATWEQGSASYAVALDLE